MIQPTYYANSIFKINYKKLFLKGFRVLIFDLDNTLADNQTKYPTQNIIKLFERLKKIGFEIFVISNNWNYRVRRFMKETKIQYFSSAFKPFTFSFIFIKSWAKEKDIKKFILIGDQLYTDIKYANKIKIASLLVEPITIKKESKITLFNRKRDQKLRKLLKKEKKLNKEMELP